MYPDFISSFHLIKSSLPTDSEGNSTGWECWLAGYNRPGLCSLTNHTTCVLCLPVSRRAAPSQLAQSQPHHSVWQSLLSEQHSQPVSVTISLLLLLYPPVLSHSTSYVVLTWPDLTMAGDVTLRLRLRMTATIMRGSTQSDWWRETWSHSPLPTLHSLHNSVFKSFQCDCNG